MSIAVGDMVGMGKRAAQGWAEARGLIFRLVSVDGEDVLVPPPDVRDDRVCVKVEGARVVEAAIG